MDMQLSNEVPELDQQSHASHTTIRTQGSRYSTLSTQTRFQNDFKLRCFTSVDPPMLFNEQLRPRPSDPDRFRMPPPYHRVWTREEH